MMPTFCGGIGNASPAAIAREAIEIIRAGTR